MLLSAELLRDIAHDFAYLGLVLLVAYALGGLGLLQLLLVQVVLVDAAGLGSTSVHVVKGLTYLSLYSSMDCALTLGFLLGEGLRIDFARDDAVNTFRGVSYTAAARFTHGLLFWILHLYCIKVDGALVSLIASSSHQRLGSGVLGVPLDSADCHALVNASVLPALR